MSDHDIARARIKEQAAKDALVLRAEYGEELSFVPYEELNEEQRIQVRDHWEGIRPNQYLYELRADGTVVARRPK
jgi:hypothetical protein